MIAEDGHPMAGGANKYISSVKDGNPSADCGLAECTDGGRFSLIHLEAVTGE